MQTAPEKTSIFSLPFASGNIAVTLIPPVQETSPHLEGISIVREFVHVYQDVQMLGHKTLISVNDECESSERSVGTGGHQQITCLFIAIIITMAQIYKSLQFECDVFNHIQAL